MRLQPGCGRRATLGKDVFGRVLAQAADGHLDWPDLAGVARKLINRFDPDAPGL
ncbi:hypothetical protein [Streptomyces microflavus]|uniref:hypothetical protein n=1 Tax=Streptomyces microflavus TaxID=1919 RepID=UPI00364EA0CE